jgi:superoxide dismutase, Fe-Mn family
MAMSSDGKTTGAEQFWDEVEASARESLQRDGALAETKRVRIADARDARKAPRTSNLREAYVAESKPYSLVTEFLSQKSKDAHLALYKGYVETLNRVSSELDTAERSKADSKHSDFRSLKLDETYNLDSVWLHELYFANCFDPHSEVYMDSMAYLRLERDFGTFEDWQKDFMGCALAAGNGWAVCGYNMYLQRYICTVVSNHSQDVMLGLYPLIVVDMHEHAMFKDYQTDKKSYLVAMMRELNWNVIEERFKKAEAIAGVLGSTNKRNQ